MKQLEKEKNIKKAKRQNLENDVAYFSRKVHQWENKEREEKRIEKKKRIELERWRKSEEEIHDRVRIEEYERERTGQEIAQR